MRIALFGLFFIGFLGKTFAQIPNLNASDRLDVATWNVEWLGSTSNGPSNESTQMSNVTQLLNALKLDIVGLCEISSASAWAELLSKCPEYSGSISTWDQTQKTAVLFKKSEFKVAYSKHILSDYSYDFASGRLPLEVGLVPLNNNYSFDTLRIWVLHLKANTGSSSQKTEAYNRRYSASMVLKSYVQKLNANQAGLILGDWNDDFDVSILSGYSTPFSNWTKDTQYLVATLPLSNAKQKSTVSYTEMIDHIVALPSLKSNIVKDSVFVINPSPWISNYGNSTSDHYPVYARFNAVKRNTGNRDLQLNNLLVFYDEAGFLKIQGLEESKIIRVEQFDFSGRLLNTYTHNFNQIVRSQPMEIIRIQLKESTISMKTVQ